MSRRALSPLLPSQGTFRLPGCSVLEFDPDRAYHQVAGLLHCFTPADRRGILPHL